MSFRDDLRAAVINIRADARHVYVGVATRAHRSIVGTGTPDPITGAPGQPVDTGFLKNSWTLDIGREVATIRTNVAYARAIEDNDRAAYNPAGALRPENLSAKGRRSVKSKVGGNHSVKLTVAAGNRIQDAVLRELGGGR